jgi:hypothetical protein
MEAGAVDTDPKQTSCRWDARYLVLHIDNYKSSLCQRIRLRSVLTLPSHTLHLVPIR